MKAQLEAWVDAHKNEILQETQAVLRIPSVEQAETKGPDAPFGRPIADALEHTLALCDRLGMKTENFDGYAGHAGWGEGKEIVAMLGHLDVVPPGGGWTKNPWGASVENGWIFARGATDDKGPTYAALWGAKAVLDVTREAGIVLGRRIRLIFGCDEESGWQCMDHYFGPAGQPKPDLAFTPDADFPLVYAEKGAFTADVSRRLPAKSVLQVAAFTSGLRANMVPDQAKALLAGDQAALDTAAHALHENTALVCEQSLEGLTVRARGRSAHGSTPREGDNAAVALMRALSSVPGLGLDDRAWLRDLVARADPDGEGFGMAGSDADTGPLTCNLGVVRAHDGNVRATFNVRYPATWDPDGTADRFATHSRAGGWLVQFANQMPPLYVPLDQEPVRTLLRVYREHTGDPTPPRTMGGRTYATAVAPHGVAFGPALPGDAEVAHQADERIAVEHLFRCAKIYAHALYELAK